MTRSQSHRRRRPASKSLIRRYKLLIIFILLIIFWISNSYFNLIPIWIWTLPEWPSNDNDQSKYNLYHNKNNKYNYDDSLSLHSPNNNNKNPTNKYQTNNNIPDDGSNNDIIITDEDDLIDNIKQSKDTNINSDKNAPNEAILNYSPKKTDINRLSYFCPKLKNLCLSGKRDKNGNFLEINSGIGSPHWITGNKSNVFNITELMFGTGIHPRLKVFRDWMYSTYDESLSNENIDNSKCTIIDESMIILHAWYPHMLWEVWNRIATQLFQYQVLDQFLSKNHRFAIMNLHNDKLSPVHDLLLSPFTDYPFVHLQSLMINQSNTLYPKFLSNTLEYFQLKWDNKLNSDNVKTAYPKQTTDCSCYRETFWCGFDLNLTKDVKQLPSVFDYLGSHEFGEFSWDMARWYKWYYQQTFGPPPQSMINSKIKPKVSFIQRRSWKRPWANLDQVINDCRTKQDLFECNVVYFEDFNHIEAIWNMSLTDVLIGIHGSGLVNGIFMSETSTMLEIIPVRAPGYATHQGTIMTWIYGRTPQRHAFFPLKPHEQKHELLRDWQKPFNLTWDRIKPFLSYLFETPHDFCFHQVPKELEEDGFRIAPKQFNKKSALYRFKPECNNFTYITW